MCIRIMNKAWFTSLTLMLSWPYERCNSTDLNEANLMLENLSDNYNVILLLFWLWRHKGYCCHVASKELKQICTWRSFSFSASFIKDMTLLLLKPLPISKYATREQEQEDEVNGAFSFHFNMWLCHLIFHFEVVFNLINLFEIIIGSVIQLIAAIIIRAEVR